MHDVSENDYDMAAAMQEAIECLPNGFCIMDEHLHPIIANQFVLDAFPEYFKAITEGADYLEANFAGARRAYPDASDQQCWTLARVIAEHMLQGRAINLIARDGRIFRALYRLMESGCYIAVYVDISDLKARERELDMLRREAEAANRAKSAFLANMSHEIRTPLNGILGMAQGLAQGALGPELREQVDIILESGNTLKSLLDDVLDLSKIETGHMEILAVEADLMQLLRRQRSLWMPRASEKAIALLLDVAPDVPEHVRIDPIRLGQCLSNLISNAIKFTERGEVRVGVTMSAAEGGMEISFAVADTGIGMDAETLGRLFTPFAQADSSISRRFGGTGLGLVITRRLAQLMGGDVIAESRTGRGSRFTLTITAEAARQRPEAATLASGAVAGASDTVAEDGARILLVDDHALNRRVARMFLAPLGYRITEAENGQQALDRLESEPFDLILLDVHMPVLDGIATLKRLRGSGRPWAGLPVIAVTADAMSGDRERLLDQGMDGYISKPVEKGLLLAEVARLLSERQSLAPPAAGPTGPPEDSAPAACVDAAMEDEEERRSECRAAAARAAARARAPAREYKIADLVEEAVEALPDGFAILDADMRPIMSNARSRNTFKEYYDGMARGLSYQEANYEGVKRAMPDRSEEEIRQRARFIEETLLSGKPIELHPSDGRIYRTVHRRMSKSRYVTVSMDITDERLQQKALQESRRQAEAANRAKTAFLANMSHEIRTPLNGILGMAQVMLQSELTAAQREQAQAILDSGRALKTLLDDVLDLAKIDAGRLALAPADCDLRALGRGLDKWRVGAEAKGLRFHVDLAPGVPNLLRLDAVRFSQCLSNLISNAVKFTGPGGEIRVGISAERRTGGIAVSVRVADTGIGMSEDMLHRLFSPFTQGDSSTSRRYAGTGLGLVITQKLAALMGGEVTVESEEGRGSVFTLTVLAQPVSGAERTGGVPVDPVAAPGRRVLFVDDHAINRRIGRLFLEPEGYTVTEAENGLEALKLLKSGEFDLVLLDIQMPILDGLQTLRCIRQSGHPWADVPVVGLVADAGGYDCERYVSEGMSGCVGKPIEQRDLLAAVGKARGAGVPPPSAPEPAASTARAFGYQRH